MTEIEAIKRIKECKNTPNFQPYTYMNEALNMAIQALQKQIPQYPLYEADGYALGVEYTIELIKHSLEKKR